MSDPEHDQMQEWNPSPPHKRSTPSTGDLARRLMDDMDPEVLDFLKTTVNSFVKWDLVIFFYDNPHTTDTADSIARYIGRDDYVIEDDLTGLVESGILQRKLTVYSLTKDPQVRERIKHFVSASDDRQFRVKAIYHLIRGVK